MSGKLERRSVLLCPADWNLKKGPQMEGGRRHGLASVLDSPATGCGLGFA